MVSFGYNPQLQLVAPVILCFYYFLISFKDFYNKNKILGKFYLFLGLTSFTVFLKINFYYYNLLIPLFIFSISLIINKKIKLTSLKLGFYIIALFNLIIIVFPDKLILKKLNEQYGQIPWNSSITWNDFKGKPKDSTIYSAQIYTSFSYKRNRMLNYPQVIIFSNMDSYSSWKQKEINAENKFLLKHEQGHFDIIELLIQNVEDSINGAWPINNKEFDNIINNYSSKNSNFTNLYDSVTNHGQIRKNQKVFDSIFDSKLRN